MLTSKDFFFCYNKKLAEKIKEANIPVITIAENIKTGKLFSMYEKTPKLQAIINDYKQAISS